MMMHRLLAFESVLPHQHTTERPLSETEKRSQDWADKADPGRADDHWLLSKRSNTGINWAVESRGLGDDCTGLGRPALGTVVRAEN